MTLRLLLALPLNSAAPVAEQHQAVTVESISEDFGMSLTVRNLVNASVPERVATIITGHKTRVVFDRYHIVSPADLQEAARKLIDTIPGTVDASNLDAHGVSC